MTYVDFRVKCFDFNQAGSVSCGYTGRQYQTVVEKCLVIIILHNQNLEKTFLAQTTNQTSFTMWAGFYVLIFHKNHRLKLKEFSSAVPLGLRVREHS